MLVSKTVNINVTDSGVTNVTERDVEVELIEEIEARADIY